MERFYPVALILGVISLIIVLFQFNEGDVLYGSLSILYSLVFLWGGSYSYRKRKGNNGKT